MKKQRRIYYVPGMISLIALPILCYFTLIPYMKEERVLEVGLYNKYKPELAPKYYMNNNQRVYYAPIRLDTSVLSLPGIKRKYYNIILNGGKDEDSKKLELFRSMIVKMKNENDSINGVHLIFGDNTKYNTFVQAINICLKEDIARYAIYTNNLWVLHKKDPKELLELRRKRKEEKRIAKKEEDALRVPKLNLSKEDKIFLLKKLWPISLILLLLSYLSIRKMTRL